MLLVFAMILAIYIFSQSTARKGNGIGFMLPFLGFTVFAQIAFTQIRLGPASIRLYLVGILILGVLINSRCQKNVSRRFAKVRGFIFAVLLFYIWVFIADIASDRFMDKGALPYFRDFFSNYLVAFGVFIALLAYVNNKSELQFIAVCLLVAVVCSGLVGIGQYYKIGLAIQIHEACNPLETLTRLQEGTYGRHHISGLSPSAVPFGYTIVTFAPFAITYALVKKSGGTWKVAIALSAFAFLAVCTYFARSRSGLIGIVLIFFGSLFIANRLFKNVNVGNFFRFGIAGAIVLVAAFGVRSMASDADVKYTDFNRLSEFSDRGRMRFIEGAIEEIQREPLWGIGGGEFTRKYGNVPHNTFLNAGVYFGAVGILFCTVFHFYFLKLCIYDLRRLQINDSSWILFGSMIGLLAYMWNGLTHNASIITGGVLCMVILGMYLAGRDIHERENRRLQMPRMVVR